jgi:pimeloyl-ACP methyl ester carboxylesterase
MAGLSSSSIVDLTVSFRVTNGNAKHDNDSKVPCNPAQAPGLQFTTDDRQYTVAGRLIGPQSAVFGRARSATIYLHGVSAYQNFDFDAVPGHDYAIQMAQLGHVSVVVEGLGYGANGVDHKIGGVSTFNGNHFCVGAQAEVLHQIIGELRSGAYTIQGDAAAPAFSRIALAGHSAGEGAVEIEAYSWHDADAVALLGPANGTESQAPQFYAHILEFVAKCEAGGDPSFPTGYAFVWPTPSIEAQDIFYDQSNPLIPAFEQLVRPDPCGVASNGGNASAIDPATGKTYAADVAAPVLLLWGDRDALCPIAGADGTNCQEQTHQVWNTHTHELTFVQLCATPPYLCGGTHAGHDFMLDDEPAQTAFRAAMNDWLTRHGF